MLPASHLNGIEAAVDFLDPSFQDRVSSKEWDKAVTLEVDPGDAILFDSRLWHSAAPCIGGKRVALAITWATAAGPDGNVPGQYPRWPMSALPPPPDPPKDGFGMDTAGFQLKVALRTLLGWDSGDSERTASTNLIKALLDSPGKLQQLPDPDVAEDLLKKFLNMRQAVLHHGAAGQNGKLLESIYQHVIQPAKAFGYEQPTLQRGGRDAMKDMKDTMQVWMQKWAEKTKSVSAVLLFGSVASGSAAKSSDLDLCVVSSGHESVERMLEILANSLEVDCLQGEGVCHINTSQQKLLALIPGLRMDCFVVENLLEVGEFLSTSEILCDPLRWQEAILYSEDRNELGRQVEQLVPRKPSDLVKKLVVTFLEAFEKAAAKMLQRDEYQVSFNLFILRDCLVKLQYLAHGGRNHIYLPKHLYRMLNSNDRQRLSSLDPNVAIHTWNVEKDAECSYCPLLLVPYFRQFQQFVTSTDPFLAAAFQCAMDPLQLQRSVESMPAILQRSGHFRIREDIFGCIAVDGGLSHPLPCGVRSILDLRSNCPVQELSNDITWINVPIPLDAGDAGKQDVQREVSSMFGQFLRALLAVDFPVLLCCEDGRKTAAVAALLDFLTQCTEGSAIAAAGQYQNQNGNDFLRTWDILNSVEMLHLLPCECRSRGNAKVSQVSDLEKLRVKIALGCGIEYPEEYHILRSKITGKVGQVDMLSLPSPHFVLAPGQPKEPCRAFEQEEVHLLRQHLFKDKPSRYPSQKPIGVFVTGVPGAGKTSCLSDILHDFGLALGKMVNLDMDGIRRFHCQYQQYAQKLTDSEDGICLQSFEDLPSWFNSADAINVLYRSPDSIVNQALQRQCDFVLPGIFDDGGT